MWLADFFESNKTIIQAQAHAIAEQQPELARISFPDKAPGLLPPDYRKPFEDARKLGITPLEVVVMGAMTNVTAGNSLAQHNDISDFSTAMKYPGFLALSLGIKTAGPLLEKMHELNQQLMEIQARAQAGSHGEGKGHGGR